MAKLTEKQLTKAEKWKTKFEAAHSAYATSLTAMEKREKIYLGTNEIKPVFEGDEAKNTPHLRNVVAELIEAQVQSYFPLPKVTAMDSSEDDLAQLIEDLLRFEVDRMPFEEINDMMERIVPVQGGGVYLTEWDSTARRGRARGKLCESYAHPKQVIPQPGVYTDIEDMDYIFLILPQTKEYIRRRYGVDVSDESERFPEVKASMDALEEAESENDMVSQIVGYFRSESGAIGRVSFVGDKVLEYTDDYQARHLMRCDDCGKVVLSGEGKCESCGSSRVSDSAERFEERYDSITLRDGTVLSPPGTNLIDPEPLKIPNYVPDVYPVVLQKNISEYGKFLGTSDVDKLESLQNMINRFEGAIAEKLCEAGVLVTLPPDAKITTKGGKNMKEVRISKPEHMNFINVFNLQGNIGQDRAQLDAVYEEMKQAIGITDSFLGRRDPTATSGVAKDFAAKQSAGRLESKSVCKASAFGRLYEVMFKFLLAYADEPISVPYRTDKGEIEYKTFNRYDFLRQDEFGEFWWDDNFIFSCDSASALATNREAMWQEIRGNYTSGAYGDPTQDETRLLFWQKMDEQHYPGASANARIFKQKLEEAKAAAMAQMQMQDQMQTQPMANGINGMPGGAAVPPDAMPII